MRQAGTEPESGVRGREPALAVARTQQGRGVGGSADARVAALLARHGAALMRVARQASFCHDDAADALQRALEIYVRRLDTVEVATEGAWMKVVVRHEAYAIRRSRGDCVADPDLDLDTVVPAADRSVEEQVLSGDRVGRSAEALRALKPDEARALMLKAHGLSYEEIGRHCGWTYTKVLCPVPTRPGRAARAAGRWRTRSKAQPARARAGRRPA